ncbi:uncharacterized protein AKAME5_001084400 [Lates japonicus]|uniref:Uncharacterized protein n=1 Tax=Lates japonicus TaxID=270547 RepID=A0AAD3R876_LATJO|nr:uncharacterized protein AKAME5_001084400 [Lates japonicus]
MKKVLRKIHSVFLKIALFPSTFGRRTGPRPPASEVLTCHLLQSKLPPWTSYCVRYSSVHNDQFGLTSTEPGLEDKFFSMLKVINLGIPCLAYGVGCWMVVGAAETVDENGPHLFAYKEEEGAQY